MKLSLLYLQTLQYTDVVFPDARMQTQMKDIFNENKRVIKGTRFWQKSEECYPGKNTRQGKQTHNTKKEHKIT